jgi:deazaflavin-dependent oxidoreductase (nitroreductase family)
MDNVNDFNKTIIAEFRDNDGKVGGQFANTNLLLLHTIGAKSGQARTNPVAYTTDGDHFIIMASKGGAPTNPDWYYNIKANPDVTVELGHEQFPARAIVAEGAERERLFGQMVAVMPGFAEYQRNTDRQIPVIVLERTK